MFNLAPKKEIEIFKGWRIQRVEDKNPYYMAYFLKSPTKAPIMLHNTDLEKLKKQITGTRLRKGVYYDTNRTSNAR